MKPTFSMLWFNKWLTSEAQNIEEMAEILDQSANELRAMAWAGITLDGGAEGDCARLVTEDPEVAREFRLERDEDDDEWVDEDEDEEE